MQTAQIDYLVIGGGVAGLEAAIALSDHGEVIVVNKGGGCSAMAQGGVAVALTADDTERLHLEDTLHAGKGKCDADTVRVMVREGPERIDDLIRWGARFDRDRLGEFALAREGAHSRRRILRAGGDATGREIVRALELEARARPSISWREDHFASELLLDDNRCVGMLLLPNGLGEPVVVSARAVLMASGGAGQVYRRTSNPETATGDGIAMAARVGVSLRHMEFVQFHPTMLAGGAHPSFLLSEALRGEGGTLLNAHGEAFMTRYHPDGDLAPRDDVARAIWQEMEKDRADHVYLDMTAFSADKLKRRFPTIMSTCAEHGIDLATTLAPVAPGAHFLMGGVRVDRSGRSGIAGLYAMGEVACSGVHGANRLASNSLLEALVFGARAGSAAAAYVRRSEPVSTAVAMSAAERIVSRRQSVDRKIIKRLRGTLQCMMWEHVGVVRDGAGLSGTLSWIREQLAGMPYDPLDRETMECLNLLTVARAITQAALDRRHGVGAHYRTDSSQLENAAAFAG